MTPSRARLPQKANFHLLSLSNLLCDYCNTASRIKSHSHPFFGLWVIVNKSTIVKYVYLYVVVYIIGFCMYIHTKYIQIIYSTIINYSMNTSGFWIQNSLSHITTHRPQASLKDPRPNNALHWIRSPATETSVPLAHLAAGGGAGASGAGTAGTGTGPAPKAGAVGTAETSSKEMQGRLGQWGPRRIWKSWTGETSSLKKCPMYLDFFAWS